MLRWILQLEEVERNDFIQSSVSFLNYNYISSVDIIRMGVRVNAKDIKDMRFLGVFKNDVLVFEAPTLDSRSKGKIKRFYEQWGTVKFDGEDENVF